MLDRHGALLLYGNAAHRPPLLRQPDGTVIRLSGGRSPALGGAAPLPAVRSEAAVCLPVGSTLLLVGGPAARPDRDVADGGEPLAQLLRSRGPEADLDALCDVALSTLAAGSGGGVSVLALRIHGGQDPALSVSQLIPTRPGLPRPLQRRLP